MNLRVIGQFLLLASIATTSIPNAYEADVSVSKEVDYIDFKQVFVENDGKDKSISLHILPVSVKALTDSEADTVKSYLFTQKDNQVYYKNKYLHGIDIDSLKIYLMESFPYESFLIDRFHNKSSDVGIYAIGNNQGYYFSVSGVTDITNVDQESFLPLSHVYAKDKNNVYFRGSIVKDADSSHFQLLEDPWGYHINGLHYAKDQHNIYSRGKVMDVVDPNINYENSEDLEVDNFLFTQNKGQTYYKKQHLPNIDFSSLKIYMMNHVSYDRYLKDRSNNDVGVYAVDKNQGYYFSLAGVVDIMNQDKESLLPLNHVYAKDKNQVYFKGSVIDGADVTTFRVLDKSFGHRTNRQHYAKDQYHVYVRGKILENANPQAFRFYTDLGFSHDDKHAFFEDQLLQGSDGASFKVVSEMTSSTGALYARDKNQAYYGNKILAVEDPQTFVGIQLELAKDHLHVYDRGEIMPNVDALTFEVIGPSNSPFYKDKNSVYSIVYDQEPNTLKTLKNVDIESAEFGHYTFINDKNGCYDVRGRKKSDQHCKR